MYSRSKNITNNNSSDFSIFVEDTDYPNSELFYRLIRFNEWEYYLITKYERRVDLISLDIYGDVSYYWVILFVNKIKVEDLRKGVTLKYIPLATLKTLMNLV